MSKVLLGIFTLLFSLSTNSSCINNSVFGFWALTPVKGILIIFNKSVNPNWPGRFCKFSKIRIKNFKSLSPQLRVPEKRTIARLKGLELGFHFGLVSPCRRAPLPSEFVSFSGTAAARGLVVTTEYYWDLLRKNMLFNCMGLVFAMGENCFEKTGFYQKTEI